MRKNLPLDKLPKVRVNQLGYLPKAVKWATVVSESKESFNWELINDMGKTVATGKSIQLGMDLSSRDLLHQIDFSTFTGEGTGFILKADGQESYPFDIRKDPHHRYWVDDEEAGYPIPPPGVLSGGPNEKATDEATAFMVQKNARSKRYADDVRSYSTNEVAINWNAPLVWVSSYLDEKYNPPSNTDTIATAAAILAILSALLILTVVVLRRRKKAA